MSEKKQSRLEPQSRDWYADLPLRDAPLDPNDRNDQPKLYIDALRVDDEVLELSREVTFGRGLMLPMGIFGICGVIFFVQLFAPSAVEIFAEYLLGGVAFLIAFGILSVMSIFYIKKSICTPRNTPVRFIRKTRKVQMLEYKTTYNPFAKWKVEFKEWSWDSVYAELTKSAGFNGKFYFEQYGLWLVECEPGSTRVKDQIVLVPDSKLPIHEHISWAYIRQFMERGRQEGSVEKFYPGSAAFINCVLYFYPYLDPTEIGRRRRAEMNFISWVLFLVVGILMFWLLIPMGVFDYIALKLAPKAKWPEEAERALAG